MAVKLKPSEQATAAKEGAGGYPHALSVRIEVVDNFVVSANTGAITATHRQQTSSGLRFVTIRTARSLNHALRAARRSG